MFWLRMLVCAVIASVLVLTMAAVGVRWFYDREEQEEKTLRVMKQINLTTMGEAPGAEERERRQQREFVREGPEDRPAPPPVSVPDRQVEGFVQVEYTVFPDGRVENVEVVGAQPSGVFEDQARELIRARDYTGQVSPAEQQGERRTEIVDFTVPASELPER
jgi:TonB family protein